MIIMLTDNHKVLILNNLKVATLIRFDFHVMCGVFHSNTVKASALALPLNDTVYIPTFSMNQVEAILV